MRPRLFATVLLALLGVSQACSGDPSMAADAVDLPKTQTPETLAIDATAVPDSAWLAADTVPDTTAATTPDSSADSSADVLAALCGNGTIDPGEACDDGNLLANDWCAADCAALIDVSTAATYDAKPSVRVLPIAAGRLTAAYSLAARKLTVLREQVYDARDATTPVPDVLYDAYFGFRADGVGGSPWLTTPPLDDVGYIDGTLDVRTVQTVGALRFETRWLTSPAVLGGRLAVVVRVTNQGPTPVTGLALTAVFNLHLDGVGQGQGEAMTRDPASGALVESHLASGRRAAFLAIGDGEVHVAADNGGAAHNPYVLGTAGQPLDDYVESSPGDDLVAGLEWRLHAKPLLAGESRWVGVLVDLRTGLEPAALASGLAALATTPEALADASEQIGASLADPVAALGSLSSLAQAVLRRQLAVLRACQTPTGETGAGQIVASLPPGQWGRTWPRDASYAAAALHALAPAWPEAGLRAQALFSFLRTGKPKLATDGSNFYQSTYIESKDPSAGIWGLGAALPAPYGVSLTRYFGDGSEDVDTNAAGPNLEWDGWGATLALATSPLDDATQTWLRVRVAEPLMALIEPTTGLLYPDSSIWERHWCPHGQCAEPETRKRHAYSNIQAERGLRHLGALLGPEGQPYTAAADGLRAAVRSKLAHVVPKTGLPALAGNVEELPYETYYLDVASVEAIVTELVHPGTPLAFGTLAAFDAHLRIGPHSPGYRRNDDPTWYDRQEWVFCDLRTVVALVRMGQRTRAASLFDWLTSVAAANHGLLPELLSDGVTEPGSEDDAIGAPDPGGWAQGAVPMCGFGAGAWILAAVALNAAP